MTGPAVCIWWRWSWWCLTPRTMESYWLAPNSSVNAARGVLHLEVPRRPVPAVVRTAVRAGPMVEEQRRPNVRPDDDVSDGEGRRDRGLLPRGRARRCTDDPAAPRLPVLIAHVGTAPDPAGGYLPPRRAGLSRIWAQRHARPGSLRLHVRSSFRGHRRLHHQARSHTVRPCFCRTTADRSGSGWRWPTPSGSWR